MVKNKSYPVPKPEKQLNNNKIEFSQSIIMDIKNNKQEESFEENKNQSFIKNNVKGWSFVALNK